MIPLDFTQRPPRGPREKMLGVYFLPRTIDKIRAQLPGGKLGGYLVDFPRGVSVFVLNKIGIDLAGLKAAVAAANDESEVAEWIRAHADLSHVEDLNRRLESFTIERLSPEDRKMVVGFHPVCTQRPELTNFFDIFEADDAQAAAPAASASPLLES